MSELPNATPEPADDPDDPERESAYSLLQRGQALIRSRHHAQAAIVLERAARAEPGKGSILEPLGRAYHHSGQYDLARDTFEQLLEVDPSAHWAHFALATTLR
jgi:Flp pilus assembly protein TadD